MERFSELMKNLSDMPKSETFVYFTKITAAINQIIPVSIAMPSASGDSAAFQFT